MDCDRWLLTYDDGIILKSGGVGGGMMALVGSIPGRETVDVRKEGCCSGRETTLRNKLPWV